MEGLMIDMHRFLSPRRRQSIHLISQFRKVVLWYVFHAVLEGTFLGNNYPHSELSYCRFRLRLRNTQSCL